MEEIQQCLKTTEEYRGIASKLSELNLPDLNTFSRTLSCSANTNHTDYGEFVSPGKEVPVIKVPENVGGKGAIVANMLTRRQ